jgi:hypothetical protein
MSSYNPNIPQTSDPILQSYGQLRANFQQINIAFSDNHVGLTEDPEFSGMHNVLTMRPQGSDPTTTSTQVAIYNKLVSSVPELFFRPSSNQTPIQLTYPSLKNTTLSQYTFIAGPFVIYTGFINNPTNGQVVTLTPGTSLKYVDLTAAHVSLQGLFIAMAIPTSINTPANSFTITYETGGPLGSFGVYYFAIGT